MANKHNGGTPPVTVSLCTVYGPEIWAEAFGRMAGVSLARSQDWIRAAFADPDGPVSRPALCTALHALYREWCWANAHWQHRGQAPVIRARIEVLALLLEGDERAAFALLRRHWSLPAQPGVCVGWARGCWRLSPDGTMTRV